MIYGSLPAQNFPKNFLAPSAFRSWMRKGHRCKTLLRENRSRFSSTTALPPRRAISIPVLNPHGPAPMINTCNYKKLPVIFFHEREIKQLQSMIHDEPVKMTAGLFVDWLNHVSHRKQSEKFKFKIKIVNFIILS